MMLLAYPLFSQGADTETPPIEPKIALKAISAFRADPTGEYALGYLSVVLNFAEQNENVLVVIDTSIFPEDFEDLQGKQKGTLLGAYIAGNVEKQLQFGVRLDSPLEGVQLMLTSYREMQIAGHLEKLPSFEKWILLNEQKQLVFPRKDENTEEP